MQNNDRSITHMIESLNNKVGGLQETGMEMGEVINAIGSSTSEMNSIMNNFVHFNHRIGCMEEEISSLVDYVVEMKQKLKKENEFIFGHDNGYPPWVYNDENGISKGRSVEIAKQIAGNINAEFHFISRPWVKIQNLLKKKQIDGILNVGWPNPDLQKDGFIPSEPYSKFNVVAFSSNNKTWLNKNNLRGTRVAILSGGVGDIINMLKSTGAEIIQCPSDSECFYQLELLNADYAFIEEQVGKYYSEKDFKGKYTVRSDSFASFDVVALFDPSRQNLKERFDLAIKKLN